MLTNKGFLVYFFDSFEDFINSDKIENDAKVVLNLSINELSSLKNEILDPSIMTILILMNSLKNIYVRFIYLKKRGYLL